jgi:hypothetical protein
MTRNLILHRIKIIIYVSITLVLLMIDSIWKGIRWFFEYQVYAFTGLFYEPYQNTSYYCRKFLNPKTLKWNCND